MITPEAMREIAEKMDGMMECWLDGGCMSEADSCKDAAAMLRSIAAEREAEAKRKDIADKKAEAAFHALLNGTPKGAE